VRWIEPEPLEIPSSLADLPPLVTQALIRQGIKTREAVQAFLKPGNYLAAPALELPGMAVAVNRIEQIIKIGEPLCIWGDFDVDGQTSTTVLFQALQALGANVTYHIPVRGTEGHGINPLHLKEIIEGGVKLILTCDTGISAHEAADYVHKHHKDMIITDHHDLPDQLPQVTAIVNPKLLSQQHPLASLSGVGVAYKLVEELCVHFPASSFSPDSLLDLVAMGLVADLVILRNDTRFLVQKGLEILRKTKRPGLKVMMEIAELNPDNLTEEHISFSLAPRLNALGRLGDANPAVELLTTSDLGRARLLATQLENYNIQRQLLCSQVTQAAEAQLRSDPSLLERPILVLENPSWHGGVIGIVASRLVERYHKPAILFTTPSDKPASGSARSVDGINITAMIAAQKDLLLNFGGHPMATGLALKQQNLPEFRRRLFKTMERDIDEKEQVEPGLRIDAWLNLTVLTPDLAITLEQLAPFGPGNEKLTLATHNLVLQSMRTIGRNKEHLSLNVADADGNSQKVLWWNGADEKLPEGKFDLAFNIRFSDWQGDRQVQMEFVDFRIIGTPDELIKWHEQVVVDCRDVKDPFTLLPNFHQSGSTIIWAEADTKAKVGGRDRNELIPAKNLVVWTIPPSSEEMQAALEVVQPRQLTLVCAHPAPENTNQFLKQLAGLLKHAISQHGGKVTLTELASATAQRRITVEKGVDWLVSRGDIELVNLEEDRLQISTGSITARRPDKEKELLYQIHALLTETTAYRKYFQQVDKDRLLP
jgi:single-stranded-DNA-specific exonuclease